jgi:GcrA cell cycle regulator
MTRPRRFADAGASAPESPRECRWPIGHPGEAGFHFCGSATVAGRVYCAQHAAIAFTKPSGRTQITRSGGRK